jgi:hypothetical protein
VINSSAVCKYPCTVKFPLESNVVISGRCDLVLYARNMFCTLHSSTIILANQITVYTLSGSSQSSS